MNEYRGRIEKNTILDKIVRWLVDITVVIGVAIFVALFMGGRLTVMGYSMVPILTNGDEVLIDRIIYHFRPPDRFDVVMFFTKDDPNHYYIKRVIGLPGEEIQIVDGKIYIDGVKLQDDISEEEILNPGLAKDAIVLGEGEYFLLGDNRNNSEDSRFQTIGIIKLSNIIGKVWLKVTSLNDIIWIQ